MDGFGNVLAQYQYGDAPVACTFCAHMDHPAYVGDTFLGGVPQRYLDTKPQVQDCGPFSVWDLPSFELREGCIHSRACDDLVGCGVILSMLSFLSENSVRANVQALFTRAEEIGLLGAVFAAKSGIIPLETPVISLETSAQTPSGVMHMGAIVRVGDKATVFDSGLVGAISAIAQSNRIPFQRSLMPGGTCEATAFQLYGYRTAGLCVALGNYHNCSPSETIEAEFVSQADSESMLSLCVAIAAQGLDAGAVQASLRTRLEDGLSTEKEKYKYLI